MTNLRALIKEILVEEVGRSYKTTLPVDDSMFNWRKVPGIDANVSPDVAHSAWRVVINQDEDEDEDEDEDYEFNDGESEKESCSIMSFKDETEANFYARARSEERLRKMQTEKDFPANFIQYKF